MTNKKADAPAEPVTTTERKPLSISVWVWIALVICISAVLILNFIDISLLVGAGVIVYAIYSLMKQSRTRGPKDPNSLSH